MNKLLKFACAGLAVAIVVGPVFADTSHEVCGRSTVLETADGHVGVCADTALPNAEVMDQLLDALRVLQENYFELWIGTWPTAIDWTAAVMSTHVAGALRSLSFGLSGHDDTRAIENLITTYFSQLLSYYFGQDTFAIRNEAYDDILWVVLGWLELIQFINFHTTVYLQTPNNGLFAAGAGMGSSQDVSEILQNQTWYGNLWTPAFAHRTRIFWDLSTSGWNTTLCDGGMIWNPRLEPYKNAITNELYIAASASMYLYFPGDPNTSPFSNPSGPPSPPDTDTSQEPHEQKHLQAALDAYRWLVGSGMKNSQGLYVDGFHISGWSNASDPNTKCNLMNTMVYTYNQGVVLTGLIGMWKVTGDKSFLDDGHSLVQNVIAATGYNLQQDKPIDNVDQLRPGELPLWYGLGRVGVLEEACDYSGMCSQDSQTFKGIFFHHLTTFCAPLDLMSATSNMTEAMNYTLDSHRASCASYVGWIRHNALAALATKDADGKFGMWWTAGILPQPSSLVALPPDVPADKNSVDYRTYGVPQDNIWVSPARSVPLDADSVSVPVPDNFGDGYGQAPLNGDSRSGASGHARLRRIAPGGALDPNIRGRGRTVETQGGGLAVLRALWEISTQTQQ